MRHRFAHEPSRDFGPLELGWADGLFTTLDANADWTLDESQRPWVDPYVAASQDDRSELAGEVGLWELSPLSDELRDLIGRTVTAVETILNDVGELSGLEIAFGDVAIVAKVEAGNLVVCSHR